jgi:hypothetical protein
MAHAYTPGLQVTDKIVVRKTRALPIPGTVVVRRGDVVHADSVIARTAIPSEVVTVNVVNQLSIAPGEIKEYMLKREGDRVAEGEPLAQNKPLIKWFKNVIKSPIEGTVENISTITGQVLLRKPPRQIELLAYIDGVVTEVEERIGAEIETTATFIQGIFGIGGETHGALQFVVDKAEEILTENKVSAEQRGKIIIGGALVEASAFRKAMEVGVRGVIAGGFNARDLRAVLGYELGVAITGDEDIPTTLVVTEGFGRIAMAQRTFDLLRRREGAIASISGRTQIRAGVMRPEIIIPYDRATLEATLEPAYVPETGMRAGDEVRIIREPYFGQLGTVRALPPELQQIETGTRVRVMEVELKDGQVVTIPRANVEIIEQ